MVARAAPSPPSEQPVMRTVRLGADIDDLRRIIGTGDKI